MELDDFKIKGNAPDRSVREDETIGHSGLDDLIGELKSADSKGRRKVFQFMIIMFVLVAVYSSSLSINKGPVALGYELLIFGFVLILIFLFWKINQISKIDYSSPVITFLKKAERRYTFMTLTDWLITIPLLIVLGTGGGFIIYYSFLKYFEDVTIPVIIYIAFFISVIIFGFWASRKNWRKDQGVILAKIKGLLKDIS